MRISIIENLDSYDKETLIIDQMIDWFKSHQESRGEEIREVKLLRQFGRCILKDFDCSEDFFEYIKGDLDEAEVADRLGIDMEDYGEDGNPYNYDAEARAMNSTTGGIGYVG